MPLGDRFDEIRRSVNVGRFDPEPGRQAKMRAETSRAREVEGWCSEIARRLTDAGVAQDKAYNIVHVTRTREGSIFNRSWRFNQHVERQAIGWSMIDKAVAHSSYGLNDTSNTGHRYISVFLAPSGICTYYATYLEGKRREGYEVEVPEAVSLELTPVDFVKLQRARFDYPNKIHGYDFPGIAHIETAVVELAARSGVA